MSYSFTVTFPTKQARDKVRAFAKKVKKESHEEEKKLKEALRILAHRDLEDKKKFIDTIDKPKQTHQNPNPSPQTNNAPPNVSQKVPH